MLYMLFIKVTPLLLWISPSFFILLFVVDELCTFKHFYLTTLPRLDFTLVNAL